MHNKVRMIRASFLCKHLLIYWQLVVFKHFYKLVMLFIKYSGVFSNISLHLYDERSKGDSC